MRRLRTALLLGLAVLAVVSSSALAQAPEAAWKAGVASVIITPDRSLWMAGYAARTKPSEGKAQDLYAKALALEDGSGARLVVVTLDLIGVPRALRDHIARQAREKYKLAPAALLLNASHTHCGPVLRT